MPGFSVTVKFGLPTATVLPFQSTDSIWCSPYAPPWTTSVRGVGLAEIHERHHRARVGHLRDERRHVLRQPRSLARGIEVAQTCIEQPASPAGLQPPCVN